MKFQPQEMNPVLTIICTSWLLGVAVNAGSEKALLFHRHTRAVIDLPDKIHRAKEKCSAWATACPLSISSKPDKKFLSDYSITGEALFAKDMYEESNLTTKVNDDICDTPFQMSAVYYMKNLSVEFGYEVYHRAGHDDKYARCTYEDYQSIEVVANSLRRDGVKNTAVNIVNFIMSNVKDRAISVFTSNGGRIIYDKSTEMKLLWLPMFKMKYSFTNMTLKTVTYEIRRNSRWPVTHKSCIDYKLGSKSYAVLNKEVEELYNDQINIFEDLILPLSKSCAPDDEACKLNQSCDSNNKCLEKWSLVPLDQFHLFPNTPLHCSYMTIVPIWTDVAKSMLEKLDQYLYALFRLREEPLHIIAGVVGNLKLPLKKRPRKSKTVYLDKENRRIPAPSAVYKIVKYILTSCKSESKEKSKSENDTVCEYSIIFIINNDPNFDPTKRLCKQNENLITEWGWDRLLPQNQNEKDHRNIYACPDNNATLNEIYGSLNLEKPKTAPGDLNLKNFPFLVGDNNIELRDIREELDKKYNKLLAGGDGVLDYSDIAYLSRGGLSDVEDGYVPENFENKRDDSDDSGDDKK